MMYQDNNFVVNVKLKTDSGFPIVETILVSHLTIFFEDLPIKTDGPMGKPPLKNEDPPHLKITVFMKTLKSNISEV